MKKRSKRRRPTALRVAIERLWRFSRQGQPSDEPPEDNLLAIAAVHARLLDLESAQRQDGPLADAVREIIDARIRRLVGWDVQ